MNQHGEAMSIFPSFCFQFTKQLPYSKKPVNFWHPGYAWACTRKTYDRIGGLYEDAILGSGDNIMALSIIQKAKYAINEQYTEEYINSIFEFEKKTKLLRIGYVPGVIRHYYHGSKKNRNYGNRWKILVDNHYNPAKHISRDENGIIVPSSQCPNTLLTSIMDYFKSRNDDEMYEGGDYSKRIKSFLSTTSFNSINSFTEQQEDPSFVSTLFNAFDSFVNPDDEEGTL
jgi:hypothetical protein